MKRTVFTLCVKMARWRSCSVVVLGKTGDRSAPGFSVVDMKKKVWGISARRGCDVNVMIPGFPSRILWCLECYPSYPGGGLCFQHLLTLICSDIPLLSKSYSPGKCDVFHSRRLAAGHCAIRLSFTSKYNVLNNSRTKIQLTYSNIVFMRLIYPTAKYIILTVFY